MPTPNYLWHAISDTDTPDLIRVACGQRTPGALRRKIKRFTRIDYPGGRSLGHKSCTRFARVLALAC